MTYKFLLKSLRWNNIFYITLFIFTFGGVNAKGNVPEMLPGNSYVCTAGPISMFVIVGNKTINVSNMHWVTGHGGILYFIDDYGDFKLYKGVIEGKEVLSKIIKTGRIKNDINFIYNHMPFICTQDNRIKTLESDPLKALYASQKIVMDGFYRKDNHNDNYHKSQTEYSSVDNDLCEETTIELEDYGEVLYDYQRRRKDHSFNLEYLQSVQYSLFMFKKLYKKMVESCNIKDSSIREFPKDLKYLEEDLDRDINSKL